MCVLDFQGDCESHQPLLEFDYNNSYQSKIGMAPIEELYGRICRSPICRADVLDGPELGPEIVYEPS